MAKKVRSALYCLTAITAKWIIGEVHKNQMTLYLCLIGQDAY